MPRQAATFEDERPRRRRLNAAARRDALLLAATDVFAAHGYEAASTKLIARAGGISEALIYGHFDSKEALYVAVLETQTRELLEHLAAATAEDGPDDGTLFRLGIEAILTFAEARPAAWRLLFSDASSGSIVADAQRRAQAATTNAIARLLAERCDFRLPADLAPDVATQAMSVLLTGALGGLAGWWHTHPDVERDQLVGLTMDVVWTGLDRLRRPPGDG
ncbi:MAG TPA: TetR/AcrR family transcriptional regulator [Solirubrobacteraceae bacterium]|jgi:AcrR family transcriptional regulator